jgi:hypothetical protein
LGTGIVRLDMTEDARCAESGAGNVGSGRSASSSSICMFNEISGMASDGRQGVAFGVVFGDSLSLSDNDGEGGCSSEAEILGGVRSGTGRMPSADLRLVKEEESGECWRRSADTKGHMSAGPLDGGLPVAGAVAEAVLA